MISSTLRFPTPYYLTLLLNPLSISCSFPSNSLLRSPQRLSPTGRQSRRTAAGEMDTGILRRRLVSLQKIRSSPTKTTKKGTLNLNPSLRNALSLTMIEMTYLNTIIPCLRVTADRAPDPCRPWSAARARVPSSRAVVIILVKGVQPPSRRWRILYAISFYGTSLYSYTTRRRRARGG